MRRWLWLIALAPTTASAGGLGVGDGGSQSMERGGAFVAKVDDPTALVLNPAGLGKIKRRVEIYVGANLLDYNETFARAGFYPAQPDETPQPSYANGTTPYPVMKTGGALPIPTIVVAERLAYGFVLAEGIVAPQSFPNRSFPCPIATNCAQDSSGAPAPQRYDVITQQALIALPSIALAYHHPRFDVGVRGSIGFGSLTASTFAWGIQNKEEDPTKDSSFHLSVSQFGIPAFGAGALVRPIDNLEIGASYSSTVKMHGKGTGSAVLGSGLGIGGQTDSIDPVPDAMASCEKGGTVADLKACVDLSIAQWAMLGARWIFRDPVRGGEKADIELDGRWENWKAASDIKVTVDGRDHITGFFLNPVTIKHGFQDTFSVRLGGSYRVGERVGIRAGLAFDTAAAPDSWTRADMDGKSRVMASVGAAYHFAEHYVVDLGFSYVAEPTITVTNVPLANTSVPNRVQPDPAQPLHVASAQDYYPYNAGTYTSSYVIGELGVTMSF
jgi:long-chain fatty acid transport protein